MYDTILVPTDGSEHARAAMDEAVALAKAHGSEIHVLHVIDTWRYDTSIESATAPLRERGEEAVGRLVGMAEGADVPVTTAVEPGRPARHILDYADEHGVDLVVMGTRGRGELERRVLGSVTGYVVAHADVPVHVVPAVEK